MSEVVVRTASLDDAPAISHLMSQLGYSTSADEMQKRLKGILSSANYMTFVPSSIKLRQSRQPVNISNSY